MSGATAAFRRPLPIQRSRHEVPDQMLELLGTPSLLAPAGEYSQH